MLDSLLKWFNVIHISFLERIEPVKEKILLFLEKLQHLTLPELIDLLAASLAVIILLYIIFNLLSYLVKISSELFKLLIQVLIIFVILATIAVIITNNNRKCFFDFEQYITRCKMPDGDDPFSKITEEKTESTGNSSSDTVK